MNKHFFETPRKLHTFSSANSTQFELKKTPSPNLTIPLPKTSKVRSLFDFTEIKIEFISHKGPLLRVPNVVVIKLNSMHHTWVCAIGSFP